MNVIPTALPEVKIIEPKVFGDERGFFMETHNAAAFAAAGLDLHFVQDNHSRSTRGVLRGLHYQLSQPQGKLVRVAAGAVFDVAVDMRRSSPRFGKWVGVELSAANKRMLWVPPGFAHGFCVLSEVAEVEYKCTTVYDPSDEIGVVWDDPDIAIAWPIRAPLLSAKDRALPRLRDLRG